MSRVRTVYITNAGGEQLLRTSCAVTSSSGREEITGTTGQKNSAERIFFAHPLQGPKGRDVAGALVFSSKFL